MNIAPESSKSRLPAVPPRRTIPIGADECLELLRGAQMGRIVFHRHAVPVVRPVSHILDGGRIFIRTRDAGAVATLATAFAGAGAVVAYQADDIDPVSHVGWSVLAVGRAELVRDEAARLRVAEMLPPWIEDDADQVVCIDPRDVTGFRMS